MVWLLTIPFIVFMTFKNLYDSGFPEFHYEPRNFLSWCMMIGVGCFISALISLAPIGIAIVIGANWQTKGVVDRSYSLMTLREKDGIEGKSYFLGVGSINDVEYYFWYRKDGKHISGGKTRRQSGVRIYQDGSEPRMITFKTEYTSEWVKKYGWIIGADVRDDTEWLPDFYIPEGSIKEGFQL